MTARTAGLTLPATAQKHAGMLRTLRYLPGGCAQGVRAGAHLTVSPRTCVEGAGCCNAAARARRRPSAGVKLADGIIEAAQGRRARVARAHRCTGPSRTTPCVQKVGATAKTPGVNPCVVWFARAKVEAGELILSPVCSLARGRCDPRPPAPARCCLDPRRRRRRRSARQR